MATAVSSVVVTPEDAGVKLRRQLGLGPSGQLRVTFIPGPGDLVGTFDHWRAGQHDPRVPVAAYSLMFYELMQRLDAHCQIIAIHPAGTSPNAPSDRFRFEQVEVLPANGRWSWMRSQRAHARDLEALVGTFDPHIVITSTHNPASSWKALARGRKLVLTAHNAFWPMGRPPTDLKGRLRKAILSVQARALDAAVCTSDECSRQLADLTGGALRTEVECPQIVARYPVEQRDLARNLLFLGRIEESKGIFLLCDVFDRLAPRFPELALTIAGAGGAETALTARIAASPHAERITFLGSLDADGVHSAIAATDLLVCPTMTTFNEGLALVGFEAAAHGVPTVISSIVPAADLLGQSCTVYEADNEHALEAALAGLLDDQGAYQARCAATATVRDMIYDRSRSWGSGLARLLLQMG